MSEFRFMTNNGIIACAADSKEEARTNLEADGHKVYGLDGEWLVQDKAVYLLEEYGEKGRSGRWARNRFYFQVYGSGGTTESEEQELASRIAGLLNACQGIPTASLSPGIVAEMAGTLSELLELLEDGTHQCFCSNSDPDFVLGPCTPCKARELLAKLKSP